MKYLLLLLLLIPLSACGTPTDRGLVFKTADPALSIGFSWAVPEPPIEPVVLPDGEVLVCNIKVNWNGTELIYHLPGQVSYERTLIEPAKDEFWACTEEDAMSFGARKAFR